MLSQLEISGLVIVSGVSISFDRGFNVITGETGAGKSILIKALGLLLGQKGTGSLVRTGHEHAMISATFVLPAAHRAWTVLRERGLPCPEQGQEGDLLIRRILQPGGRSRTWVNDIPVTLSTIRTLGYFLMDIFGQHENQRLLNPGEHTAMVDSFLDEALTNRVRRQYRTCRESVRAIQRLDETLVLKRKEQDYMQFRLAELDTFAPDEQDYSDLVEGVRSAGQSLETYERIGRLEQVLDEGAAGEPLGQLLRQAGRIAAEGAGCLPGELAVRLEGLAGELDEISFAVSSLKREADINPADLEAARERLSGYKDLFRKCAVDDVAALLVEKQRLEQELAFIDEAVGTLDEKTAELVHQVAALNKACQALARARRKAGKEVRRIVENELRELGMPGVKLQVSWRPLTPATSLPGLAAVSGDVAARWFECLQMLGTLSEAGSETARLLFSANPGEDPAPLHQIASGGEISRIMLAFKKALAAGAGTCLLVFDEIDSGISGQTADRVGEKLAELAGSYQVICISHLPQVAAWATAHFLVEKKVSGKKTESQILRVEGGARDREMARLLSGQQITAPGLKNARAMLRERRRPREDAP